MKIKVIRYASLVLLILCMCAIFCFSAQPAETSNETSNGVVEQVISVLWPTYDSLSEFAKKDIVVTFVIPIRKLAHLFEFFMLEVFAFVFLSTLNGVLKNRRSVISVLFGVAFAVTDELHQIFVPGRACRFYDVVVDTFGILTAFLICIIISRIWRRRRDEQ